MNETGKHSAFRGTICKQRLLHGKCVRTICIHELSSVRKHTSEHSERVSFLIRINE